LTEKRTLLQVNATVIAGLLILLTIQATAEGGIPFLMELGASKGAIDMYEKAMNDTSLDPILLESMKKRHTELKLEAMEKDLRLRNIPNFWFIELFLNPVTTLTLSMAFFIVSIMREFDVAGEMATKLGLWLSYGGFLVMFIAVFFMIALPITWS